MHGLGLVQGVGLGAGGEAVQEERVQGWAGAVVEGGWAVRCPLSDSEHGRLGPGWHVFASPAPTFTESRSVNTSLNCFFQYLFIHFSFGRNTSLISPVP